MSEQPSSAGLGDEFGKLAQNLRGLFQAAWQSEERARVQRELNTGARELEAMLSTLLNQAAQSESAQRVRAEAEEWQARLRQGEAEAKLRAELTEILQRVNRELEGLANRWNPVQPASPRVQPQGGASTPEEASPPQKE